MNKFNDLVEYARSVRINALKSVYRSKASHIGSGYSCVELLVYLYANWLKVFPETKDQEKYDKLKEEWSKKIMEQIKHPELRPKVKPVVKPEITPEFEGRREERRKAAGTTERRS